MVPKFGLGNKEKKIVTSFEVESCNITITRDFLPSTWLGIIFSMDSPDKNVMT